MKIALLLVVFALSEIHATVLSQTTLHDVKFQNVALKDALTEIESQTNFKFLYRADLVDVNQVTNFKAKNVDADVLLTQLLTDANLDYKIVNNYLVVLSPKMAVKITGTVTSSSDNQPLPGVSIVEKGTSNGTITDADGNFTLSVSDANAVLVFSSVGFESQEISLEGKTSVEVAMKEKNEEIEQVVVVGYGTAKKSDISGSVVSVNNKDMMKKNPTNILQGLQGVAAGVMVTAQDGAPDANAAIRIRGVATITGSADPLYVVDGVQVGSNANFLNPSDVESIEVLKDASATAIYGAAGANGVIMITTKHGKAGSSHISFSADYGIQTLARKLDVGDVDQYAKNIRVAHVNDNTSIMNNIFLETYDGKRKNIDWQEELTRPALRQQYNLSASGGTEKTQSSFSLSYLKHDGLVVNTNFDRITGRANVNTKVANFIEVGGDINFVHSESKGSNGGLGNNGNLSSLRDMAFFIPTMDYIDVNGNLISPNVVNANGTYGTFVRRTEREIEGYPTQNLYAYQMENNGLNKKNQMLLSAYATINLFKGLSFKTIASYEYKSDSYDRFWQPTGKRYANDGVTEIMQDGADYTYNFQIDNNHKNKLAIESFLTYNWSNDVHNITFMGGNSVSSSNGTWCTASAKGFLGENIRDISQTSDLSSRFGNGAYDFKVRSLSYFGRATYSLMNRYILTGTVRRDGSSTFGAGNRFGTFPSAAFAWRISEESFMKSISQVSNLKLRLGWGQTGNSGSSSKADKTVSSISTKDVAYYFYPSYGSPAGWATTRLVSNGYITPLVDTNVKWETNEQTNIGIDLGLLNNTLNITADYFIRTSKDLLIDRSIRSSAGQLTVYTNYGEIENKGVEFSINYRKQLNKDWNIGITLTGSSLKNKVIKMGSDLYSVNETSTNDGSNQGAVGTASSSHWDNHSICREGYAVGSYYGYVVEGVFQSVDEVNTANAKAVAAGHEYYQVKETTAGDFKFKDLNNDGFIDAKDMTILGNGFPKLNYGLNITASYKNWDIAVNTYGVAGLDIYSYSAMCLSSMYSTDNGTIPNILKDASSEAWTKENGSNSLARLSMLDKNYNVRGSSAWVKKGDYFKINNIQIGYTFDKSLLKSIKMESARIYIGVQNLACFSKYKKYGDPEVGQGSVLFTGLDTGRYPNPRIFSFGLNIQF